MPQWATWKHFILFWFFSFFCSWPSSVCWSTSNISVLCSGVKPYACTMCDMRFIQRYQLERHSLTHTGMCALFEPRPHFLWLRSCMRFHIAVYMAASNSSLYCFLSLYWQVLILSCTCKELHVHLYNNICSHTLSMKWHDDIAEMPTPLIGLEF